MSWLLKALAGVAMCGAGLVAQAQGEAFTPAKNLTAFADEAALQAWFEPFVAERRRREEERRRQEEERRLRQEEVRKKWEAENPGKT